MNDDNLPWRELATEAERRLRQAGVECPDLEARRLVEQASGSFGAEYVLVLDRPATERGVAQFDSMLARRLAGEPLQYVLGSWGFRSLDLFVDRRVLIPRPETETVTELVLAEVDRLATRRGQPLRVVDLGTGSGAIALSIAAEREGVEVWATDTSPDALAVARANLAGLGMRAKGMRLSHGRWFEALPAELRGRVDLVVSNPPYIAEGDDLPCAVAEWEPMEALIAGPRGTEDLEVLIDGAVAWLADDGVLVLELAPHQAESMAERARAAGFEDVRTERDMAGRERVLVARCQGIR